MLIQLQYTCFSNMANYIVSIIWLTNPANCDNCHSKRLHVSIINAHLVFRLCGYTLPTETFTSKTDEMMIVFRTNWTVPWSTAKRGFKASFVAGKI